MGEHTDVADEAAHYLLVVHALDDTYRGSALFRDDLPALGADLARDGGADGWAG